MVVVPMRVRIGAYLGPLQPYVLGRRRRVFLMPDVVLEEEVPTVLL